MSFQTAVWVGAVVNSLLAAGVLVVRVRMSRPSALRVVDLVVPASVGLLGTVAQFVLLAARYDVVGFGIINILYLQLVLGVPLAAVVALSLRWWPEASGSRAGASGPVTVLLVASLLLAPAGYYATHIEPFRLQTDEVTVALSGDRAGSSPITIGVLADIQADVLLDHHFEAVDRVMAASPDVILVAGDIYQGDEAGFVEQLPRFRDLLGRLEAPGGVYVVPGDADFADWLDRLTDGLDAEVIGDRLVDVTIRDRRIMIGGLPLLPEAGSTVPGSLNDQADDVVTVMLAHRPDWALQLPPDSRVDLVVAGHTHGGQIQLPFIGPVMTMSQVPRSVAAGGLHEIAGNPIYVSPGVGWEHLGAPRVRFGAPPSVGILTLG